MSEAPEVWNVLTMKGGELSLLKNLSEDECRAVVQRIQGGDPWSQESIYDTVMASQPQRTSPHSPQRLSANVRRQNGWGVDRLDCWGSKGGELVIWPKPDDYDARLAEAFKVAALVKSTNDAVDLARAQRAA